MAAWPVDPEKFDCFLLGLQVGTGELLQLNHVSGGLSDLFFTGPAGGDIDGLPTLAAGVRSTPAVGWDHDGASGDSDGEQNSWLHRCLLMWTLYKQN